MHLCSIRNGKEMWRKEGGREQKPVFSKAIILLLSQESDLKAKVPESPCTL